MRWLAVVALLAALAAGSVPGQEALGQGASAETQEDETILPEGEGRSETFGYCTACHSTALIRRSRFTRQQWDGLMDWMSERQGMTPLEGEFREIIVGYLATHFGPDQLPPRGRNPFLN